MDRDRNQRGSNSGESGQGDPGAWEDWFSEFDPEQTRPISQRQPPEEFTYRPSGNRNQQQPPNGAPSRYGYSATPADIRRGDGRNPQQPTNQPRYGQGGVPNRQPQGGPYRSYQQLPPPAPDPVPRNTRTNASSANPATRPPATGPAPNAPARSIKPKKRSKVRRVLLGAFLFLFVLLCGGGAYIFSRLQPVVSTVFVDSGRPAQTISLTERRNILLMGLDTRSDNESRSDTMILVSIDPINKTAGMLSIPRDLWVDIPDFQNQTFGPNRINAAYMFGKNTGLDNGGPLLAIQTVEQNFDVKIDNFVEVNFSGFRSMVDALGGVTVDVPRPLIDNEYPADYGSAYQRVYVPSGIQHMDGRTALQYVRSRHADSDLGRNQRQQSVLLALKEQALSLNIIPKLNDVLGEVTGTLKTNLSLEELAALGSLARDIPRDKIQDLAIDDTMTSETNVDGAQVLTPDWSKIRPLVRKLVSDDAITREDAKIMVQNGTDTQGLATKNGDLVSGDGLNVVGVGNPADGGGGRYPVTTIYDFTGGQKPATIAELQKLLKIDAKNVKPGLEKDKLAGVDILVMIGDDKANQ